MHYITDKSNLMILLTISIQRGTGREIKISPGIIDKYEDLASYKLVAATGSHNIYVVITTHFMRILAAFFALLVLPTLKYTNHKVCFIAADAVAFSLENLQNQRVVVRSILISIILVNKPKD